MIELPPTSHVFCRCSDVPIRTPGRRDPGICAHGECLNDAMDHPCATCGRPICLECFLADFVACDD